MPLFLRESDVERLLTMDMALQAVEDAFRHLLSGAAVNRPRQRVRSGQIMMQVMPAGTADVAGFKYYVSGRPGTRFWVHLFDAETGEFLAIMEADKLGQMRTGAASGVATRHMARADAETVGIFGTGWQARTQALAVCAVRKVRRITAFGRDPGRLTRFCQEVRQTTNTEVVPAKSPEEVVRGSHILITITNATEPLFDGRWLEPGTHVNAAGSNRAHARELDATAVFRAGLIAVDSLEQAKVESGDLLGAEREGKFRWEEAVEMADIVAGRRKGRDDAEQITLFESHGIAIWDVTTASLVYEKALAEGAGKKLPF